MTRRRRIAWIAAFVLALLIGLELFCRYYLGLGDPPLSRADPEIEYLFVGPRTYHRFGNTIVYNSFSMRTHEFDARRKNPDEIRIMICGDSIINGGALTDQSQLMTTRMEEHLKAEQHRPAVVMNVSAGSWGPPNYLAYVKRFGFFEANALVIVVSGGDYADAPTWVPTVGVSPDFPDKTPTVALGEAITRYLPRYVPILAGPTPLPLPVTQGQIDQAMGAFRELVSMAQQRNIPVIVAYQREQAEYGKPETEGHMAFRQACSALNVKIIELADVFEPDMKGGGKPYRDEGHPNAHGQELMEKAIYPAVREAIPKPPS
jgi:hypothetical protein